MEVATLATSTMSWEILAATVELRLNELFSHKEAKNMPKKPIRFFVSDISILIYVGRHV